ncbi:hypothetical protein GCM10009675_40390 [Prauserella alba]|uniref:Uncharacterized protein n=1 Tax=Prauserella alba TaxID=176898 RepID=A0ABN1VJQ5_9PSEU
MTARDHGPGGVHSAETMEAPTMPFLAAERALLGAPVEASLTSPEIEVEWPTDDMDDPHGTAQARRSDEPLAQHRSAQQMPPGQPGDRWQPPLDGSELARVLQLMRKKWNM